MARTIPCGLRSRDFVTRGRISYVSFLVADFDSLRRVRRFFCKEFAMKFGAVSMILAGLLLAGCKKGSDPVYMTPPATPVPSSPEAATGGPAAPSSSGSSGQESGTSSAAADLKPVPIEAGVATLAPENTKIVFVGTHSGAKPDPRTGGFGKFTGKAEVDADTKALKAVSVEIETGSLWTQIEMLTNHLKNADFFDVKEHPQAAFQSTKIEAGDATGSVTITGNLTLHGATKEISFPATVSITDAGLTLSSKFTIDRTEFGMTFGEGKVEKKVALTVVIGEKTEGK